MQRLGTFNRSYSLVLSEDPINWGIRLGWNPVGQNGRIAPLPLLTSQMCSLLLFTLFHHSSHKGLLIHSSIQSKVTTVMMLILTKMFLNVYTDKNASADNVMFIVKVWPVMLLRSDQSAFLVIWIFGLVWSPIQIRSEYILSYLILWFGLVTKSDQIRVHF